MAALVGHEAPSFTASYVAPHHGIVENHDFKPGKDGKYWILFFYPLDFTFVCPSELIALNNRIEKFKDLCAEVMSISVDSHFTHLAWQELPVNKGGVGNLQYKMVSDIKHDIMKSYGVEKYDEGVALRACFIIDREGIVRSQIVNDLPIGRNIDEIIRTLEALQHHEDHGDVCPAGWQKGKQSMDASPSGVADYLSNHVKDLD